VIGGSLGRHGGFSLKNKKLDAEKRKTLVIVKALEDRGNVLLDSESPRLLT
jgi:hypothetical protein